MDLLKLNDFSSKTFKALSSTYLKREKKTILCLQYMYILKNTLVK